MRALHGVRRCGTTGVLAVAAIAILGAGPALAVTSDPTFGPHTGTFGLHTLIDSFEYPAVRCEYGTGDGMLKRMKIRRPIVFGVNRSGGTDTQTVGWRYRVEYSNAFTAGTGYSNWPDLYVSTIKKSTASDLHNAHFAPRTYTFGGGVSDHNFYRVSVELLWYYPSSTNKDGKAVHLPNYYFDAKGTFGYPVPTDFGCEPSYQPPVAAPGRGSVALNAPGNRPAISGDPTLGPHSGIYGVHTLVDTDEYTGATCVFGSNHRLMKIAFRRPIVFGADRSGGTDTQWVGWKPTIEYYDGSPPAYYSDWPDLHVGSLTKAQATDQYNAQWLPGSYNFGTYDVSQHDYYRVSYTMLWYYPSKSQLDGSAVHMPYWYTYDHYSGPSGTSGSSNGCNWADNIV
jgi:hypothetical protein